MPSLTTVPEIPHDRLPVSLDLSFDTSRFELACHDDKDTIRAKVNLNDFEITFILTRSTFRSPYCRGALNPPSSPLRLRLAMMIQDVKHCQFLLVTFIQN